MSRIETSIRIDRRIEDVFDFVTTPRSWLSWHPSSVRVRGDTDHPLHLGEQVAEDFIVAGKTGCVTWTVTDRVEPQRWAITGSVNRAGGGTITYGLMPDGEGTLFTRSFVYEMDNWLLTLLDRLFIRRRIDAESKLALQRLKSIMETA